MPTARAKKETATTTKKVATKTETTEKVVEEKPVEGKSVKEKKVFTDSDYILCHQYVMVD